MTFDKIASSAREFLRGPRTVDSALSAFSLIASELRKTEAHHRANAINDRKVAAQFIANAQLHDDDAIRAARVADRLDNLLA